MPFFVRKSKPPPREAWDQAKYEYEAAIQRCYQWKKVTLALCSVQKFLAFNFKRKPFVETDYKFRGVVYEQGKFETHVQCEVEILPASTPEDHIGGFVLTHMSTVNDKTRREEQPLELSVTLRDSTSMLKASLIDGLRDAALSGFRFMHVELECVEITSEELEKAMSDMREQGYAAMRDILAVKMWPKIELQNAPAWARRAD
ncbi:MAG TPA: hypothetical protein VMF32_18760 [Xanthobacteraceae bacterium]|nr:hypothetical protein [Xanthobacteraceae bacterium]